MSVATFLVLVALILAVVSLVKPAWPVLGVAVLLVCVSLLIPSFVR
jgi:hypothetical protein